MENKHVIKEVKGGFVKEKRVHNKDYSHKGEKSVVTLLGEKKSLVELYRTDNFTCCQVSDLG